MALAIWYSCGTLRFMAPGTTVHHLAFTRFATSTDRFMSASMRSRALAGGSTKVGLRMSTWATKTPISISSSAMAAAIRSWVASSRPFMPLSSRAVKPSSFMNRSWSTRSSPAWARNMPKWGAYFSPNPAPLGVGAGVLSRSFPRAVANTEGAAAVAAAAAAPRRKWRRCMGKGAGEGT